MREAASVQLVRLTGGVLPEGFERLRLEAAAEGYGFVGQLAETIRGGGLDGERDLPVVLAAFAAGELVAIGGLTEDPYSPEPDLVRVRHVYVAPAARGGGIGRTLAVALIQQGLALAGRLCLRAADGRAAAFWEALGFVAVTGHPTRTHLLAR